MCSTRMTLLVGTTKGAFLISGGNDRSGWAIQGPYCDGWPINHMIGDPETGIIWAGGGGEWHGAGIWRSEDGGTSWKVTRLTKGKMDDWAANDLNFAKMIGWTDEPLPFTDAFAQIGCSATRTVRCMPAPNQRTFWPVKTAVKNGSGTCSDGSPLCR